ncbi:hypothetical protein D3C79_570260 [compost metagenome]
MQHFAPFHHQRLLVALITGADVQDDFVGGQHLGGLHLLHLGGSLFADATDVEVAGLAHHLVQDGEVEVGLFRLDAGELGLHGRLLGDDAAILRHGLGELQGTDATGLADDVRLVPGDERAQDHLVGHPIDDVQVGQGLAGNLAHALAGHQGRDLEGVRHLAGGTHHHPLEHHPHLTVVDLLEDLGHHGLEVDGGETHLVGGTELVPQVIGDLLDTDLVGGAPQIEEAVVHTAAALDELVGGHAGVEAAGEQAQHVLLGRHGEASHAVVDRTDDVELVVFHFQVDLDIRLLEAHTGGFTVLVEAATHIALQLQGAEVVLADATGAHAEGLAFQAIAPDGAGLLEDVVQIGKVAQLHFEEVLDARDTGQGLEIPGVELIVAGAHYQLVPVHPHAGVFVKAAQHVTDVALQHLGETLTH